MGRPQLATEAAILDSREVAQALDLSPDAVNELARRRRLKAYKQGRFWRFHLRDVMQFREAQGHDED